MGGKKVFISYSRQDIDYIQSLVEALRLQGFVVWFDKNIISGTDWDDTIEAEIKQADAIVLVLSKTSVASDVVKDEISYAMSFGKSINPIKIEDCEVPMRLARKQFIDFAALGHEAGFERLVNDLQHSLNLSEENKSISKKDFNPPVANANSSSPKKSKKIAKYILIGIVSVILFIAIKTLIAFLAW